MLKRLAPPQNPCLTLDDAKLHLRVDNDVEDSQIELQLEAAIDMVEYNTTRALSEATYEQTFDAWPTKGYIDLGVAPVRDVTAVVYNDTDGNEQTIAGSSWHWRGTQDGARIFFATGFSGPTLFGAGADITARFSAGYNGPNQAADPPELQCPARARALVLMILGGWYANREIAVVGSSVNELPLGAQHLLNNLRIYR